ncbi:MAG: acyl-CoA dehydrogenase [Acidobacteria bacterium]|nr:acyl-CoA dehydrogenase [Acidobacteriota bacterium]MXZ70285.1 acyl-CoA dehydrogenase [Acidobacteriota bacterium]MYD69699.1 acyl-CoA dehydrogenase [Acidobacteriota bacterium]MYJ03574.1 acyl-CoA dehydrogenase [Acidobacteriota bacterium]
MRIEYTPEQAAFQARVRRFADTVVVPRAAQIDAEDVFPTELVVDAARHGLLGVTLPVDVGGAGRDTVSYALAIEAVSAASATLAVILTVQNSLVAEVIHRFGTLAQQATWLRRLVSGEAIGAFALSEPNAGADAANQETLAVADGDDYRLTGHKVWVANGAVADVVLLFAATEPHGGAKGISAFLVPGVTPGLRRVGRRDSLGVRGLGCVDLELDAAVVGRDALVGAPGAGFRIALAALDRGRIAIGAQALGVGGAAFEAALAHARTRRTFGEPIGHHQAIQWMLADSATELAAARMLVLRAASAAEQQERVILEAAMAKLSASEAAHRAADRAMQVLASAGYTRGSTVDRLYRDARATEIYQGTSEVQRMIIAEQVIGPAEP